MYHRNLNNLFRNHKIYNRAKKLMDHILVINIIKLFEARHNTQNAKFAVGIMVIISTNLEKNNLHR
jgi:hypothetical protein